MRNIIPGRLFLLILILFGGSTSALASNPGLTYTGRLLKPNGMPVDATNVQFRIQVKTPQSSGCLMYEEIHQKDLSKSAGAFSITLNDGSAIQGNSEPFTLERAFQNRGSLTFPLAKCSGTNSITFNPTDGRQLNVEFRIGPGGTWESLPAQQINFVPMALEAINLNGFRANQFFRVVDGAGEPVDMGAWSPSAYTRLTGIVAGTENITGSAAGFTGSLAGDVTGGMTSTSVAALRGRPVSATAPTGGQVLTWNSVTNQWEPTNLPAGSAPAWADITGKPTTVAGYGITDAGTVTNIATGTGLTGGPITTSGTISIAAGGVGTTQLADGAVTDNKVTTISINKLTSGAGLYLTYQPDGTACAPGQVLKWNNSRWECANDNDTVTGVTSVGVSVPGYMTSSGGPITSSGTIALGFDSQAQNSVFAGPTSGSGAPAFRSLLISDVRAGSAGNPAFWNISGACAAGEMPTHSSVTDQVTCEPYAITSSQVTTALGYTPLQSSDLSGYVPTSRTVTAGTGLTGGGDLSADRTFAVNVGTGANQIPQLDGSGKLAGSVIPDLSWSQITSGTPTTLAGYGITNAVTNAGNTPSIQAGLDGAKPTAGTAGRLYVSTDTQQIYRDDGSDWVLVGSSGGGTVTNIATGTGLTGGPITETGTISIATGGVSSTELASNAVTTAKIADGQVTDAKITGVAVNKIASGAGLYLTYQPDGSACTPGQVLKWNNSRWECGADNDSATAETDPTVEAYAKQAPSADFTTPGDVLTIANSAITTAKINDGAVTTAKIADSQVTTAKIADSQVTTAKIGDSQVTTAKIADGQVTDAKITGVAVNKIASGAGLYLTYQPDGSACTAGQVLKWNNSRWECGADNDTTTAETDPTVEAYAKQTPSADFTTPGDVLTIANSAITTAKINDGAVTTAKIADSQITTAKIADGQVTNAKIAGMSADKLTSGAGLYLTYQPDGSACTPGQVLKWNNSRWECGADNDSATAETDPTVEAFAKQAPNSSDFSVTGNELTLNTVPIAKGGTGATSRADAINNLLPDQNLENGKILQTDGTNVSWVPAPATGVTSVDVSVPAYMTSTGGAITSSGTIALGFASQAQNSVFAGPTSGSGAPAFRSLLISDVRAGSAGNPAFWNISGACAAGEMPTHSSVTDQVTCEPYAITSSQVTTALGYTPLQSSDISGLVPNTRTVTAGTGLTGGGDLSADRSFAVNVGTGANQIPQLDGSGKLAGSVIPDLSWSQITSGTPTTLAGYGITNAVTNAGNTPSIQAGLDGAKPAAGTAGRLYVSTDTQQIYRDDGSNWILVGTGLAGGGTVTNIATGTGLTGGPITGTGTISIAAEGVTSTELASNAVTTAKIADGQVTNAKIAGMSADKLTSGAGLYLTYQPDGTACSPGQVLKWNNSRWECAADNDSATGVTSVDISVPAYMTSTGGPVTSTGTIAVDFDSQAQSAVFAGPASGSGAPTFRNLFIADIKANSAGNPAFWNISGACAAGEMPTYSSVTDQVSCTTYSLTSSQVTTALGYTPLQSSDLSGLVPDSRTVTAGTGLTGGGDLSADRSLAVDVGTGANQIPQLDGSGKLVSSVLPTGLLADGSSAGGDLSGTYPNPTIATSAVTTAKIQDGAVTTAKLDNSGVTAGTYPKVQVDAKGRVVDGAALLASDIPNLDWTKITSGTPTTLAGYGITNAVTNAGNTPSIQAGLDGAKPAAGTAGRLYVSTDTQQIYRDNGSSWILVGTGLAGGGTVTNIATGAGLTGGPITGTGTISIAAGGVTSTELASNAVTTDKIADSQVTNAKIVGMSADKLTSGAGLYLTYQPDGTACSPGQVLKWNNSRWECGADNDSTGVTSVDISVPAYMTVTGGPITNSGTIAVGFGSQAESAVFAGPASGSGAPAFRNLFIADIKANSAGNPAFWNISGACAAGQMPTYSSVLDQVSCAAYSLTSSQVTTALGFTPADNSAAVLLGGNTVTGTMEVGTSSNHNLAFETNGTTRMTLDTSGRLGIGTSSPSRMLEVVGTTLSPLMVHRSTGETNAVRTTAIYKHRTSATIAEGFGVDFTFAIEGNGQSEQPIAHIMAVRNGNNSSGRLEFGTYSSGALSTKMAILPGGNVGIGLINPSERLQVAGRVRATEFCIDGNCISSWPSSSGGTLTGVTGTANQIAVDNTNAAVPALSLADLAVSPAGSYGSTTQVPAITVDAKGRVTAVTNTNIDLSPVGKTLPTNQVWVGNGSNQAAARFFGAGDLRNSTGTAQIPASCAASQTLTWSAITDVFSCTNISITTAQISDFPSLGTAATKNFGTSAGNLVELDGSSRIPASLLPTDVVTTTTGFVQNGNSFGAAATLGTNDGFDLNLETSGSPRLTITSTGNVGIGITNPGQKLHLVGTSGTTLRIVDGNQGVGKVLTSDANGVASWVSPSGTGDVRADGTVPMTAPLRIPDGTLAAPSITFTNDLDTGLFRNNTNEVGLATGGVFATIFSNSGMRSDNSSAYYLRHENSAAMPSYTWGMYPTTGIYNPAANAIGFSTSGTEKVRISATGSVGIGTQSPNQLLTVEGPMSLRAQAAPTSTANYGKIYVDSGDSNKLKFMNPAGAVTDLTAGGGGDFLRNGTLAMTGNLRLGANWLGNDGGAEGIKFTTTGEATIGNDNASTYSNPAALSVVRNGNVPFISIEHVGSDTMMLGKDNGDYFTFASENSMNGIQFRTNGVWNTNPYINTAPIAMTIRNSGNVGIGTSNPDSTLHVAGTGIRSTGTVNESPLGVDRVDMGVQNGLPRLILESTTFANPWQIANDVGELALFTHAPGGSFGIYVNGNDRMFINSSGNVGIGTTSPTSKLHVVGDIQYTGTITDVSDRRLKEDIKPVDDALSVVRQIPIFSYVMRDDPNKKTEYGVMAQDLQWLLPNLVKPVDDQHFGVNYVGLIPWSIRAIQQVDREVASLKEENQALRGRVEALEAQNQRIEAMLRQLLEEKSSGQGK